jgi:hypothetical protein
MNVFRTSAVRHIRFRPTQIARTGTFQHPRPASFFTRTRANFVKHVEYARKESPILLNVAIIATTASLCLLSYLVYDDYVNVHPQFAAYPEAVERQLRLALHHTHISPDPDTAAMYFDRALQSAAESGMNPYSKEVVGIRIRSAEMFEKFGHAESAVKVLNSIITNCEKKVDDPTIPVYPPQNGQEPVPPVTRQQLLRYILESKVKVASLYQSDYLQNENMAKQSLSDAVGLLVKESKDPITQGFTTDNAAGMSMMEIASILSQMGDLYATSGEESNAVQTYMLALQPLRAACDGSRSCKEVQVFSNIAATMQVAMKKPGAKINGKPATKQSLQDARRAALGWADQAIATADLVPLQAKDSICEDSALTARLTRADLLLDSDQRQKAKETFISVLPKLREKGNTAVAKIVEDRLKTMEKE